MKIRTLLIALVACTIAPNANAIVWRHHSLTATVEWTGGTPINGFPSFSLTDTRNTATPTAYQASFGLPVRVNFSLDDNLVDNPHPNADLIQQKFSFSYNGLGDPSTRQFRASLNDEFVFSILGGTLIDPGAVGQIAPYASRVVEQGTYSNGVFTSNGIILDLSQQASLAVGAGTYRYTASFDSDWFTSNQSFYLANNSNLLIANEPVPEPLTLATLGIGLAGAIARKRRRAM